MLALGTIPAIGQEFGIDDMPGLLSLAHEGLENPEGCDSCHDLDFNVDGNRCLVCHDQIAGRIAAEKGVHREVTVNDCATCHAEHHGRDADLRPIDPTNFNHAEETGFALRGFHGEFAGDCSNCHTTRSFLNLTTDCTTCHTDVHKTTLGDDCTACHSVDTHFKNASRAFHKSSLLPLEGRHLDVPCASCHWDGVTKGTPTGCYDCHWIRRQDDPFRTQLGVECESCHEPIGWIPATWNHGVATGFQIGSQHLTVDCDGCHPDHRFEGPVTPDCYSCHREDYERARNPDHAAAGFPTQCDVCHRPNDISWNQAVFDHDYRLQGQHAILECAACHATGIYAGTPRSCVGCHLDDYNSSRDPDHRAAGFPTTCTLCHGRADGSWQDADFDHPYTLVGNHATLDCSDCHSSGIYAGLPSDCADCHLNDYNGTTSPNHQSAGFPTDCDTCHRQSDPDWFQATYAHSVWPLVGSHIAQQCNACHTGNVYAGLPSECVDCHLDDYNATTSPDHQSAGFPTACETCHQPTTWTGATFDHPYALVGVHATLDCSDCHSSGVYSGLPSDCVDCHLDDYNSATRPNHTAAGFPTDCELCHRQTDSSWRQGVFDHTYFPINSGKHAGTECNDCHINPSSYMIFSCLDSGCHLPGDVNEIHEGEPGYDYDSALCYSCHPNGRPPQDAVFRMRPSHG